MVFVGRHRRPLDREIVARSHPAIRWLLKRPWERWGGWVIIICGLIIMAVRVIRG